MAEIYTNMDLVCNDTCCIYEGENGTQDIICFPDYNFTDYNDIEIAPVWEVGVRWTIVIPMVLVGVFGNLTIIIILLKNRLLMKTNINIFILNMAFSDLILALAGPIPFTIRGINQFWVLGELWCYLDGFIQVTVMQVSVTSLTIISIDRLRGIFLSKYQHLKRWKAFLIIACIWIASGLLGVPFYIYRNYGVHEWADLNDVYCEEILYKTKYYWMVIIVVLNWIPLIIITTCYSLVFAGFEKRKMKVEGKEHPCILKMKKRFIKMLFAMVIAFSLCWMPFQGFIMYREKIIIHDGGQVMNQRAYDLAFNITQYNVYLYPLVNPFIYGFMHQNFKYGFRVTFPCFFKDQADVVLMPGQGTRAYVWNRTSKTRASFTAGSSKVIKNCLQRSLGLNHTLRRSLSFNDADELSSSTILVEEFVKRPTVKFQRSSSDTLEYKMDNNETKRQNSYRSLNQKERNQKPITDNLLLQAKKNEETKRHYKRK